MKNKILIKVVTYLIVFLVGVAIVPISQHNKAKKLQERVIYTITIDAEFINLRPKIDLDSDIIMKVYKGEKYQVVEYHEGNSFNWYRVIYEDYKTGWVASGKTEPWVVIENI